MCLGIWALEIYVSFLPWQHTEPCLREYTPTANQLLSYLTLPSPIAQNSSCLLGPKPKTSLANAHPSISMLCFENQTPGIWLFSCLFLLCKLFMGLWLPYGHLPSEEGSLHKKRHGGGVAVSSSWYPQTHKLGTTSAQYFFYKKMDIICKYISIRGIFFLPNIHPAR